MAERGFVLVYRPPPPGPSGGAPATCHLHLQTTPMTWADAEAACARHNDGGHLVTITSEDEQAALEHFALNRLRQLPPGYPEGAAAISPSHWLASEVFLTTRVMRTGVWIGLSDTGGESYCRGQLFSWADGTQGADAHGHSYQHWVRQRYSPSFAVTTHHCQCWSGCLTISCHQSPVSIVSMLTGLCLTGYWRAEQLWRLQPAPLL